MLIDLSVVLISRNQEWNIDRLIRSVLDGTSCVRSREIVLVDSASTDGTVHLARRYRITILRMLPGQRLTAAAGRYTGYKNSSGGLVLFLDGDMELCSGWLERALAVIRHESDVAVVSGQVIDLPKTPLCGTKMNREQPSDSVTTAEVPFVGGAAMYKRSVLQQVGTFNPYLYSDEEPELSLRIRHARYRLLRLEIPIAYHYSDPWEAISTLVSRRERNLYLGLGQNLRHHLGDELFWPYLRERGHGCFAALGLAAGGASFIISAFTSRWSWFSVWCLVSALFLLLYAVRKHSLQGVVYSLVHRLFVTEGTFRGFLLKPMDPTTHPVRFGVDRDTTQEGAVLSGSSRVPEEL